MSALTCGTGSTLRKNSKYRWAVVNSAAGGVVRSIWSGAKGAARNFFRDGNELLASMVLEPLETRQLLSAPTITPLGEQYSTEASWFSFYTDFYDDDTFDTHTGTIDWGDGTSEPAGISDSGSGYGYASGSHIYADNGVYNATLTVTDNNSEWSQMSFTVNVANIAPRLTIAAPAIVNEGSSFTLQLAAMDPGPDTISNWAINWGDGSAVQNLPGDATNVLHNYATGPAVRTITVTATDEDGAWVSSALALDPTFGTVGKTTTNFGSSDFGRAVAVQPDGKIVAVGGGFINSPQGYGFAVARYLANGTLDTTFDTDGKVLTNITSATDNAWAIAIQSDGKIVVGGDANGDFAVVRYNSNGSLDTTFDTDGIVTTNFGATESLRGIAIQSDGKIVAVGSGTSNFAVARYNSNGSLDTSFDTDGKLTTDFGGTDSASAVTIQPDGKIVVAGASNGNFAVARYSTSGVLDTSFDTDGKATITFSGSGGAYGVAVVSGKIVLGGGTAGNFAAARLNSNGSLDLTFDGDGKATADMGGWESVTAATISSDGRIVVGATQWNVVGSNDFAIVRFAANGAIDSSFADAGKLNVDFGVSDNLLGLAIGPDGKIVAIGYNSTVDFAVARINPNNTVRVNDLPVITYSDISSFTESYWGSAYFEFSDGDLSDTFTAAINWGDGTPLDTGVPTAQWAGGGSASGSHVYADNGVYNATLTITDSAGGVTNYPFTVTVANVAPHLNASASYPVYEGSPMTLRLWATDVGADTVSSWTINWGDGTAPQNVPGAAPTVTHTYADGATSNTVTITAYDEDGNYSTTAIGLETTFGTFGKTTTDFGSTFDTANGIAIMPGGKIVVGGYTSTNDGYDMVVARYTADGVLDTTFSGDGKVVVSLGDQFDYILDLALQSDGKILVTGWSGDNMALLRFKSNGDLDATFGGGDGIVLTDFGSTDQAYTLAIAPDGKIVVGGVSNGNWAIARYLSDGSLDTSFDGDGKVTRSWGNYAVVRALAIMADGRIVAAGEANSQFAIARFGANGALDTSFDGDGVKPVTVGSFGAATGVAIQGDGNILISGYAGGNQSDFAVIRLTAAGALDTSFSGDGIQITDFGNSADVGRDLLIRSDGKIVVAGNTWQSLTGNDVALARYNSDGSLDTAFGSGGILAGDLGSSDAAMAMAFDTEQRIVIAGSSGGDGLVARFVPQSVVEVRNVAPVLTISGNATVEVNNPYTLDLSAVDPGADTIAHWDINWGDGSPTQNVPGHPASVPHTYTGNPRAYTITATATDEDGTFAANSLLIDSCKCGWGFRETGGSQGGAAHAIADAATVMLVEGDSFEATLWKNITITPDLDEVSVTFTNLSFPGIDLSDINDAFEIAFVDADGNSLVPTIGPGRDTFFNITEGVGMSRGTGVTFDGERVALDVSALPDGTVGRLEVRLINNDGDIGTSTTVRILCENQNAHQVLWGINEQTGSLFAMWNYHSAAATFVDYGQVYTNPSNPPIGNNIEAFTVDGDGTAYMVRNTAVNGLAAPVLMKVDLNNLVYGNKVVVTVVGRIPLTFNAVQDNISEVSFDPITGKLFALFKDEVDSGTNPIDHVLVIDKTNAQILEDLGEMTGQGSSVRRAESFAFDGQGRLFVADDVTDGLYEISPTTGDIIAVVDGNLKNNISPSFTTLKIEGLAFDPATDDLLASDDDNDRLLAFKTDATNMRVLENLLEFGLPDVEGMDFITMFKSPPEHRAVWTIDQDNGHVVLFTDYKTPNTAFIDFGPIRIPASGTGVMTAVSDIEAMTIDSDGTAYIALDDGSPAGYVDRPKLLKVNLMNLNSMQTAVDATIVGDFFANTTTHSISGLAVNRTTGILYGIDYNETSANDVLVTVNKLTGAITAVGTMTNGTQAVTVGEDLAFDANGNLYVTDTGDDDVYTINTATGAVLTVFDNAVEGGLSPTATLLEGIGFDPVNGDLIGADDTNNRFIKITASNGANSVVATLPTAMGDAEALAFFPSSAVGGVPFVPGSNDTGEEGDGSGTFAGNLPPSQSINISELANVTSQFNVTYGRTSFNDDANVLYAHLTLKRTSGTSILGPLLVGVRGITAPGVRLHDRHGVTSNGVSYYDISSLLNEGETTSADDVIDIDIAFDDPSGVGFGYELLILGALNHAPFFTSDPYAGQQGQATPVEIDVNNRVLEVVAKNGNQLQYVLTGQDPDNDDFTFSLVSNPANMSIQTIAGKPTLVWTPQSPADLGAHYVRLRITDSRGLYDPANDQVLTVRVVTGANRAPRFTSDPIVFAYAGRVYTYDANAFDPDGDTLLFDDPGNPGGNFTIGSANGIVTWTPTFADIGQPIHVTLVVSDQQSPELTDTQSYDIVVLEDPDVPQPGTKDLTISNILLDGLSCNAQQLRAQGIVSATVKNLGTGAVDAPFDVLFFEDLDFNGQFNAAQDHVLGRTHVDQRMLAGATINVAATLSGDLLFAGAHVWGFVDSGNVIAESNENNNTDRSNRDCKVDPVPGEFNPVIEWRRTEGSNPFTIMPEYPVVYSAPTVGDINKDGIPDVVVPTGYGADGAIGPVRALDGATGAELWQIAPEDFPGTVYDSANFASTDNGLALADLDDDGFLEIIAIQNSQRHVVVFDHTGHLKSSWQQTDYLSRMNYWSYPAVADLDADGDPEIVVGAYVLDNTGQLIAELNNGGSTPSSIPIIADLNGDGTSEIIHGSNVFLANGDPAPFWNNTLGIYGHAGVANFDADPAPEVAVVQWGYYYLLDTDGTVLQGPVSIGSAGGSPTIADFDGDPGLEVGIATNNQYVVIDDDGTVRWTYATQEFSSGVTGSTVFDFEGDGRAEIVYRDERFLYVFRVPTDPAATVLEEALKLDGFSSITGHEMPIVADVDGDGNAEIVVPQDQGSGRGIYVIGDLNDTWVPTRQIWNEQSYHVTNVNDDGTIPQHEQASWLTHNTYRLNVIPDPNFDPLDAPDLIPSFVRVNQQLSQTTYTARIGNAGNLFAPSGVNVSFYDGDPNLGGTLIGTVQTSGTIAVGNYRDVSLTVTGTPVADLWVVADDDGTGEGRVRECNENNNAYSLIAGSAPITPNDPPVITSTPVDHVDEHEIYNYDVNATDANGNALLYELVNKPERMSIDPVTGEIHWTPRSSEIGAHLVIVRVSDGRGGVALQRFTVTVTTTNEAPVITSVPLGPAKINEPYEYDVDAEDANGDVLFYTIDSASIARGITIDLLSGLLTWTPTTLGSFPIQITVSDGRGGIATQRFILPVVAENTPPHITTTPEGPIYLNEIWTYQLSAFDIEDGVTPDPDLTFSLDSAGTNLGMTINPSTGQLSWVPRALGTFTVTVTVTDSGGASASQILSLPVERRPILNLPAKITSTPTGPAMTNRPWEYLVEATDPEGDAINLSVVAFKDANGNTIAGYQTSTPNPGQMLIKWTPAAGVAAPVHIEVRALDDSLAGETQSFDLPVLENAPPVILRAVSQAGAIIGTQGTYDFDVFDYNGDTLTFQLVDINGTPVSATFTPGSLAASNNPDDPDTVQFTYTATVAGAQDLRLRVSDGQSTVEHTIHLIVSDGTSHAPVASLTARRVIAANTTFSAQVTASDPDNDALVYTLSFVTGDPTKPQPTGMTIDASTGLITWTPTEAQITSDATHPYIYYVHVSDGTSIVDIGPVDLTVVARLTNGAPLITSDPTGIRASGDRPLIYNATAVDPDNDPITWTLLEGPVTAHIDPQSGQFVWQPASDEFGRDQTARIKASDPYGAGSIQTIILKAEETFVPGNAPPRITSTPPMPGPAGVTYTYIVRATDPDGERITFSISAQSVNASGITITAIDSTAARVTWTNPPAAATRDFIIVATDERGAFGSQHIMLGIGSGNVDTPPTIISTPTFSVMSGQNYNYQVVVDNPTGVTYGLEITKEDGTPVPTPPWLTINTSTGLLSGSTTTLGKYWVRVTASKNGSATSQRYLLAVVENSPANKAPVIQPADPLSAAVGQHFSYDVLASDPDGDEITFWLIDTNGNLVSDLDGLHIAAGGRVTWTVPTGATNRSFTVRAVDDEGAYSNQAFSIVIVADQAPTASLRLANSGAPEAGDTVGFVVDANDDVGITEVHVTLTAPWITGSVTLSVAPNGLATYVLPRNVAGQQLTAVATVLDTAGHSVTTSPLTVDVANVDNAAPVVSVANVDWGLMIDSPTQIIGQIYDPDDNLVYYSITAHPSNGGPGVKLYEQGAFNGGTRIAGVGGFADDEVITSISPLVLSNGTYAMEVFAQDATGKSSSLRFGAQVESPFKLGTFNLSFVDMTTNVVGVPITITRRYDTLKVNEHGAFGYGWSMEITQGTLSVDVPGGGDELLGDSGYEAPYRAGTRISITLPGGEQYNFTAIPYVVPAPWGVGGFLGLMDTYVLGFQPDVGQVSKLELLGGHSYGVPDGLRVPSYMGDEIMSAMVYYDDDTGELREAGLMGGGTPFNPASADINLDFLLTAKDGTQYVFDSASGKLQTVTDANGNELHLDGDNLTTYDADGNQTSAIRIVYETGPGNQKRVKEIHDGQDNFIHYEYNDKGDLSVVTDRTGRKSRFFYGELHQDLNDPEVTQLPDHVLTTIKDHENVVSLLRLGFFKDGRIKAMRDASNTRQGLDYQISGPLVGLPEGWVVEVINQYDNADHIVGVTEIARDGFGNIARQMVRENIGPDLVPGTSDDQWIVSVFDYDQDGRDTSRWQPFRSFGDARYTDAPTVKMSTTIYNQAGNPIEDRDIFNNVTKFEYDSAGRITVVTNALNKETINEYDSKGNKTKMIDAGGNSTKFTYDSNGNVRTVTDALNRVVSDTTYNNQGLKQAATDVNGFTTNFGYDAYGNRQTESYIGIDPDTQLPVTMTYRTDYDLEARMTDTTDIQGNGSTMGYDTAGRTATYENKWGETDQFIYDANGNAIQHIFADGSRSETVFDSLGRAIYSTTKHALGVTITDGYGIVYDEVGRIKYKNRLQNVQIVIEPDPTYPSKSRSRLEGTPTIKGQGERRYDAKGRLELSIEPDGMETRYEYDDLDRQTALILDASGPMPYRTEYRYDELGRIYWTKTPDGLITQNTFDDLGRVTRTTYNDGTFTTTSYDELGRITSTTDTMGRTTDYIYDDVNNDRRVVEPAVQDPGTGNWVRPSIFYDYDSFDHLVAVTDANNHTTHFVYDEAGRMVSRTLPLQQTETWTYGDFTNSEAETIHGVLLSHKDADDRHVDYEYDGKGRINKEKWFAAGAPTAERVIDITYDDRGALDHRVDSVSGLIDYDFDAKGRLTKRATPEGIVNYEYDDQNDRLSRMYTGTVANPITDLQYEYDKLGRLEHIHVIKQDGVTVNQTTTYVYGLNGGILNVLLANGVTGTLSYDPETSRMTDIVWSKSGQPNVSYHYDYNDIGQRTRIVSVNGAVGRTVDYVYDNLGHLKQETINGTQLITYKYDLMGNRVEMNDSVNGVTSYDYDDNDRLQSESKGNTQITYEYDDSGETTAKITSVNGSETGRIVYTYDARGQLKDVNLDADATQELNYAYDAEGNLVSRTYEGVNRTYVLDVNNPTGYSQVIEEWNSGDQKATFAYGLGLISQQLDGAQTNYVLHDGLMSVIDFTDGAGIVTDRWSYDSFGVAQHTGSTGNVHLLSSERWDPELGMYELRARRYDPSTGRFSSADPLGSTDASLLNSYLYANADPINLVDPSGQSFLTGLLATIGIMATAASIILPAVATGMAAKQLLDVADFVIAIRQGLDAGWLELEDFMPMHLTAQMMGLELAHRVASGALEFYKVALDVTSFGQVIGFMETAGDIGGFIWKTITEEDGTWTNTVAHGGATNIEKVGKIVLKMHKHHLIPRAALAHIDDAWELGRGFAKANPNLMDAPFQLHEAMFSWKKAGKILAPTTNRTTKAVIADFGGAEGYMKTLGEFYKDLQSKPIKLPNGSFTDPKNYKGIWDAFKKAKDVMPGNPFAGI